MFALIENIVKINKDGIEVERNAIGIVKDQIYGMSWIHNKTSHSLVFDSPVYITYLNKEEVIMALPISTPNEFVLYNESGEILQRLTILDVVPNMIGEIIYPKIDKNGKLLGFLTRYDIGEFFIEFNIKTLAFGSVNRTRI